ncbi:hypothetical protein A2V61_02415 [Candidatus Woesebacteria bacterium RBG_19FT_COMBO_47_8]|uniref:Uncharacterized protein n=1 Tax=Candidatus Woesebacteria bacterium RBG_13_46_13 TaxID=1802479 RepID=A0A1F7X4M2_9BACT|nr:MAG: hypothetical protein A2Y68_00695 [Candidatus Woesebacteria bacterium RBG_13_46_13]OGM17167.1 MAG: hypothetical protein A2V61_02415 [Candidatus Woesebacteria bacterium RBG_19FT_COMBO_47_8]HJX59433.1 hypothetical protein [Patescibacteria group bacterium]
MRDKERSRPGVPDIPGLHKGRIEAQREVWASRRRVGFPDRRADLFVIAKDDEYFLDLPYLAIPGRDDLPSLSSWVPRVQSITGAIFTTRWVDVAPDSSLDEVLPLGGRYLIEGKISPKIAKAAKISRLVPQEIFGGLPAAMRQQEEIAHDLGVNKGVEQRRIESVLVGIHGLTETLLEGDITEMTLQKMAKETEKILRHENLLKSKDAIWSKVVDYTLRAAKKDRLNRTNPTASRILARAAYLRVVDLELLLREARQKAVRTFEYLETVNVASRLAFEDALQALAEAEKRIEASGGYLVNGTHTHLMARESWEIEGIVRGVADNVLEPIQAAPYLGVAALARAVLTGVRYKSREGISQLREVLRYVGLEKELDKASVADYLILRYGTPAVRRLHHAQTLLGMALADPDYKETAVFK